MRASSEAGVPSVGASGEGAGRDVERSAVPRREEEWTLWASRTLDCEGVDFYAPKKAGGGGVHAQSCTRQIILRVRSELLV